MLKFDDDNLARVARVVLRFNPYMQSHTVESTVAYMKEVAGNLNLKGGYVATAGFMLTGYYPAWDNVTMHVVASVSDCCIPESK